MSNPTEILPRTSIAAVGWRDTSNNDYVRIYTQDAKGGIRESRYDGQSRQWTGGAEQDDITKDDSIPKTKLYSPLTAITQANGLSVRVYYLTVDNIIQELCQDYGREWYASQLGSARFEASPVSRLAVVGQSKKSINSLYYQKTNGAIGELNKSINSKWTDGGSFGDDIGADYDYKPFVGTGLTAVTTGGGIDTVDIFYQSAGRTLAQLTRDGSSVWRKGDLPKLDMAAATTNLAAIAYGYDEPPRSQLFFLDTNNVSTEVGYYSGQWKTGVNHPGRSTSVPGSDIAVVIVQHSQDREDIHDVRYYIQDEENQIQEYRWEKGWPDYQKSSIVPTGNLQ